MKSEKPKKTAAQRQREKRERDKSAGIERINVRTTLGFKKLIQDLAKMGLDGRTIDAALDAVAADRQISLRQQSDFAGQLAQLREDLVARLADTQQDL